MSLREGESMRSLTTSFALVIFMVSGSLAPAQSPQPDTKAAAAASKVASKEEVNELRGEVAAQRQTIEELKALVEKLVNAKQPVADTGAAQIRPVADAPSIASDVSVNGAIRLRNAVMVEANALPVAEQAAPPAAAPPKKDVPLTAGWSGEHFFIRSPDGQFSISPYGYLDTDYRAYKGDGAPSDTFLVRRARFGFQGNYGSHFDFAILTDANSTTGAIVRDAYLNVRIRPEFQFQAGQFKEPFAQDTGIGATNLDFVERGLQSLLYPSTVTAFRSPGITLHGDIYGGTIQWWAGAFNGRGGVTNNVTNEADFVGRLRFYPFRKSKGDWLKQLAFGGSIDHSRSRGLSNDVSFSGALPDAAYTFFPQLAINGPIERYEGEFTYIKGPAAVRGEYVQMQEQRWDIGTETPGGLGRGWGAFEAAVRYTGIQANAPGSSFLNFYTPEFVPSYDYHTDEITFGLNWYPNYWVKYMVNVGIDQLHQPSAIGQLPQNFFVVLQRLQFRF